MATITKRGPHQWQAKIRRTGYPDQSSTHNTKAEAEEWVTGIEADMDRGSFQDRRHLVKTTLKELLERYESEITPTKKSASKEHYVVKHLLTTTLAKTSLNNIESMDIVQYRNERAKVVGPASVAKEMCPVSIVTLLLNGAIVAYTTQSRVCVGQNHRSTVSGD